MEIKIYTSQWVGAENLLITRLTGDVNIAEIVKWEKSLLNATEEIPNKSNFKIFVDLFGFKAVDIEAHKRFRSIIPLVLSQYGWRVGYLNLFEEANDLTLTSKRGIKCFGAAHVHHDATKIEKYQSMFGNKTEQYFTDPVMARMWISKLSISS
ncbi:MAG: hypothetical protein ABJH04_19120 [Cyclobacteriaceae bacterium]